MNNKPQYLYTAYRNKDDSIIIFDATAKECQEALGIKRQTFYRMVMNGGTKSITLIKTSVRDAKNDMNQ